MNVIITGKNIELTDAIKKYIEEKMSKLDQYLKDIEPVEVSVWVQANKGKGEDWSKVEVTLTMPHLTVRSEELSQDLYGAIDIVQEKLERKLRENKERIIEKRREVTGEIDPKDLEKIVKRKDFDLGSAIDESDAITRMELLGHDFYIYKDSKTNKQSVVYRRKDGGYGVIAGK